MSEAITIQIAGRSYTIITDETREYTQELADYVTSKILEVKRGSGGSPLDCATISALIIADELNKTKSASKTSQKSKK